MKNINVAPMIFIYTENYAWLESNHSVRYGQSTWGRPYEWSFAIIISIWFGHSMTVIWSKSSPEYADAENRSFCHRLRKKCVRREKLFSAWILSWLRNDLNQTIVINDIQNRYRIRKTKLFRRLVIIFWSQTPVFSMPTPYSITFLQKSWIVPWIRSWNIFPIWSTFQPAWFSICPCLTFWPWSSWIESALFPGLVKIMTAGKNISLMIIRRLSLKSFFRANSRQQILQWKVTGM